MTKIWAKIIKDQRTISNKIIAIDEHYHSSKLFNFMVQVCYELDIPTPTVLYSHKYNFTNFNITKFKSTDFVEEVDFDMLTIEAVFDK
ncbi:MAG: hypothetical protein FWF56_05185 [Firmicutes bacterium]|nr:hypothetical protein [Bacillota bacterium]MCL1953373.1 hypothetical protein [Bacillota bacterium]